MELLRKVKNWIQERNLTAPGDQVLIGLSGGADSVCLLLCLLALREELGITLSAVHIHHGIRGEEAQGDADFCRELSERCGIPFRLIRIDVPARAAQRRESLEEAGRTARYEAFRAEAERLAREHPGHRVRIAVAHQMDDQAETVLMNLCRGSGIRGLGGMPPEQGGVIRPLLPCRREEIEMWLRERGESWREDATNTDAAYLRNRLRREVIPLLTAEVNARSVEHLARLASEAGEIDQCLEREAERWLTNRGEERKEGGDVREVRLPASALSSLPEVLSGRILSKAVEKVSGTRKNLTARHIRALRALLHAQTGRRLDLPGKVQARRGYRALRIQKEEEENAQTEGKEDPPAAVFRTFPAESAEKFPENRYTKWFDCDKIKGSVQFRHRRTGDCIALKNGGRKTVKADMIDAKIPAEKRESIWLLADEEKVLWMVGYRVSAACSVTSQTETVLEVTVDDAALRSGAGEEQGAREESRESAVSGAQITEADESKHVREESNERQDQHSDIGDGSEPEN